MLLSMLSIALKQIIKLQIHEHSHRNEAINKSQNLSEINQAK